MCMSHNSSSYFFWISQVLKWNEVPEINFGIIPYIPLMGICGLHQVLTIFGLLGIGCASSFNCNFTGRTTFLPILGFIHFYIELITVAKSFCHLLKREERLWGILYADSSCRCRFMISAVKIKTHLTVFERLNIQYSWIPDPSTFQV